MQRSLLLPLFLISLFLFAGCGHSKKYPPEFEITKENGQTILKKYIGSDENVTIPEGVTEIGVEAFEDCSFITSLEIPGSVKKIGRKAFYRCSSLKSVEIPKDVTKIEHAAFQYCSSLKSVKIPNGVTKIERDVFNGCTSLKSIEIPEGVTEIGDNAFFSCNSLKSVTIPNSVTKIEKSAFSCCLSLISVIIPDSVTEIGEKVFSGCDDLKGISNSPRLTIRTPKGSKAEEYAKKNKIPVKGLNEEITSSENSGKDVKKDSGKDVEKIVEEIYEPEMDQTDNSAFKNSDFKIIQKDGKTILGKYTGSNEKVTIPEGVTEIGRDAFRGCKSLTFVEIPEGVMKIGEWTFNDCSSLKSVEIPETVKEIGDYAFRGCSSLTSVVIPKGVTEIGRDVFGGCKSLTSVVIPEGVTKIGKSAFQICSSLKSVEIPETVKEIGDYAFRGCSSLTSVLIPKGVTEIGRSTFYDCNSLTSVVIPEGVTKIGESAFYDCNSLTSVEIPEGVKEIGKTTFYGCKSITSIKIPEGVTEIEESTFLGCSSLTSVIIPEGVKEIGINAFLHCKSLNSVVIPEGVTKIGRGAFCDCRSLSSIVIPESVTEIDFSFNYSPNLTIYTPKGSKAEEFAKKIRVSSKDRAEFFASAENSNEVVASTDDERHADEAPQIVQGDNPDFKIIQEGGQTILEKYTGSDKRVIIPKGVTKIGSNAFWGCSFLTSVEIPEGVTEIGEDAFFYCKSLTSITIPNSVAEIGDAAFTGCMALKNWPISSTHPYFKSDGICLMTKDGKKLVACLCSANKCRIPDGIENIANMAFSGCSFLTSVEIPESITEIGYNAFCNCISLVSVVIPEGVTKIGEGAFWGCKALRIVVVPQGVTEIDENTFSNCSSLTSIVIPEGVTKIGGGAFFRCISLTSVVIPDSVQEIGAEAFDVCSSLKKWSISSTHPYFKSDGIALLTKDGKKLIACPGVKGEYRIPEGVTEIGEYSFYECTSLTSVVIPEGVTMIGDDAFYECTSLTSVIIPEGVTKIGRGAFEECSSLTSVVIPEGVTKIEENTFVGCNSLTSVVIPDGVTEIGENAFSECSALMSVVIPESVIKFENGIFENCSKLNICSLKGSKAEEYAKAKGIPFKVDSGELASSGNSIKMTRPQIQEKPQKKDPQIDLSNFEITQKNGKKTLKKYKGSDENVIIPDGVTRIGENAFEGCSSLKSVRIPQTVTKIGESAFMSCRSLTSVTIPESVTKIEDSAFWSCPNLTINAPKGSKAEKYAKEYGISFKPLVVQHAKPDRTPIKENNPGLTHSTVLKAGDRKVLTVDGIEYAFRWCPPGEFMMGGRYGKPVHKVELTKGFWLLETEVTQEMWQSVMGNNPSDFEGDKNPVERVNLDDCQEFCKKLSIGKTIKLPTEAQWEYACRAGTTTDYCWGNDIDLLWQYGNYCDKSYTGEHRGQDKNHDDGYDKTAPVRSYKPNAWGLYDMHGNVREWCSDYYDYDYYARSPVKDPENTIAPNNSLFRSGTSMPRVIRGGCWDSMGGDCESESRFFWAPESRDNALGLRIILVPDQE